MLCRPRQCPALPPSPLPGLNPSRRWSGSLRASSKPSGDRGPLLPPPTLAPRPARTPPPRSRRDLQCDAPTSRRLAGSRSGAAATPGRRGRDGGGGSLGAGRRRSVERRMDAAAERLLREPWETRAGPALCARWGPAGGSGFRSLPFPWVSRNAPALRPSSNQVQAGGRGGRISSSGAPPWAIPPMTPGRRTAILDSGSPPAKAQPSAP